MKNEKTTTKPAFDPEVPPREGFIFYRTFYEALASMKPMARLHLYDVIMRYALYGKKPTGLNIEQERIFIIIRPQLDANERKRQAKYKKKAIKKNNGEELNELKMKKMTIYKYSTIYNMNRSPLKDNSNMKENEYDNGYIERQTVGSNPSELPPIRVSVFENYYATEPLGCVDLMKWFKTAKFKKSVIAFRTTSDEKVRQRIKRNLPSITPSGIFKTRSRDGLVQHSGFVCIDIDHKDNGVFGPEWFEKKKLVAKTFDSLFCASMSISGNGLCLIFRIAHPDQHLTQFDALVREIYEKTGLVADQGCCDVCRLRGASYDAYPYINPHAKPYRGVLKERTARAKVRTAREKELLDEKVYKLIKKIREEKGYHRRLSRLVLHRMRLGARIRQGGGASVISSGQHALQKYYPTECDEQFAKCLRSRKIGIETFPWICKKHGVTFK